MKLGVKELFGQDCITREDGQLLYDQIHPELRSNRPVELDFQGVSVFASPFLNSAIGQLLRDIEGPTLNRLLRITNLAPDGTTVLKRVIDNAKEYYADPTKRRAIDDTLRGESGED